MALRTANGNLVCAEGGGGRDLIANRDREGAWEKFTMVDCDNGLVALRAVNGQYVCAENDGASNLIANRPLAREWEKFYLVELPGGKVALKALCNDQYVRAVNGGGGALIADRSVIGRDETFTLLETRPHRRIRLKASNGKYVCAENGGGGIFNANRDLALQYETFTLVDHGNGRVSLQTWHGKFMQAIAGGSSGQIGADPDAAKEWETFDLIDQGNGKVAFMAINGKYVSSEDGNGPMTANRAAVGSWETFSLEEAKIEWQSLGQTSLGTPSIVCPSATRRDVFIRGTENALWWRTRLDGVWGEWMRIGHELGSEPTAVSLHSNHIDVFFRGANGENLHVYWQGTGFSQPHNLGGTTNAQLGATIRGTGLSALHRGMDGCLYVKSYNNNAWESDWFCLEGKLASAPAATSSGGDNRLDVFVRGMDDGLWHFYYTDSDDWRLGRVKQETINSAPTVVTPGEKRITVFTRAWDGALQSLDFDGNQGPGWHSWVRLSDEVTSPASVAKAPNGHINLVACGVGGTVLYAEMDTCRWPVPAPVTSVATQLAALAVHTQESPIQSFSGSSTAANNWMASVPGINTKTLRDICILRAHDSATASLTNTLAPGAKPDFLTTIYPTFDADWLFDQLVVGVVPILRTPTRAFLDCLVTPMATRINVRIRQLLKGWGCAHRNTPLQQLENGIRWLDVRVCCVNGELRTHHGLTGTLVSDVLDDVHTFVSSNHGEVVILELSAMDSLSDANHDEFLGMIISKLGSGSTDYLLPYTTNVKLANTPIGTMTNNGAQSRVVVLYSAPPSGKDRRKAHPQGDKIWEQDFDMNRSPNQDGELPNQILNRQRDFLASHVVTPPNMVDMDWAYAPADNDIYASAAMIVLSELRIPPFNILPMYSLQLMALAINFTLADFVKSLPRSSLEKITRINVDFADLSPATAISIALSHRDFDAINALSWTDTVGAIWGTIRDEVWSKLLDLVKLIGLAQLFEAAAELVIGLCKVIPELANNVKRTADVALSWGISMASTAAALVSQYCIGHVAAARLVTDNAEQAAAILKGTFQRPAEEVYHALQSVYGVSEDAAKAVLGGVGYAADEIEDIAGAVGDWLGSLF